MSSKKEDVTFPEDCFNRAPDNDVLLEKLLANKLPYFAPGRLNLRLSDQRNYVSSKLNNREKRRRGRE